MKKTCRIVLIYFSILLCESAIAVNLMSAFSSGRHTEAIRVHHDFINFQTGVPNRHGLAFGGQFTYETSASHLWGFSGGLGYYISNDLGTNRNLETERSILTPTVDVNMFAEVFLRWSNENTEITVGRQRVETPFAATFDDFMVPITFSGISFVSRAIPGVIIKMHHLLEIKNRQAQNFENVGLFALDRYGATTKETSGTTLLGLTYQLSRLKVTGWYYHFADIMGLVWSEISHEFDFEQWKPFVGAHFGSQSESGERLLGEIGSKLYGIKLGVEYRQSKISIGIDSISEGIFRAPFSFFSSANNASFTSSSITGLENVGVGNAVRVELRHDFTRLLSSNLSYSTFDFSGNKDFNEMGLTTKYRFLGKFRGLGIQLQFARLSGSALPTGFNELEEYRTHLQYLF